MIQSSHTAQTLPFFSFVWTVKAVFSLYLTCVYFPSLLVFLQLPVSSFQWILKCKESSKSAFLSLLIWCSVSLFFKSVFKLLASTYYYIFITLNINFCSYLYVWTVNYAYKHVHVQVEIFWLDNNSIRAERSAPWDSQKLSSLTDTSSVKKPHHTDCTVCISSPIGKNAIYVHIKCKISPGFGKEKLSYS